MDVNEARRVFMQGPDAARDDLCDVLSVSDPNAQAVLVALATDSETVVRRYAVWALGHAEARTPALDGALVAALADGDAVVRAIAVDGVRSSPVQDPSVPSTLLALMDDEAVGETRAFLALEGLAGGHVAIPRAIDALLAHRPGAYAAMRLLFTFDEVSPEIEGAARAGLEDPNPTVRSQAQHWLAIHGEE